MDIDIAIDDTKNSIIQTINNSGLSACIITYILSTILTECDKMAKLDLVRKRNELELKNNNEEENNVESE